MQFRSEDTQIELEKRQSEKEVSENYKQRYEGPTSVPHFFFFLGLKISLFFPFFPFLLFLFFFLIFTPPETRRELALSQASSKGTSVSESLVSETFRKDITRLEALVSEKEKERKGLDEAVRDLRTKIEQYRDAQEGMMRAHEENLQAVERDFEQALERMKSQLDVRLLIFHQRPTASNVGNVLSFSNPWPPPSSRSTKRSRLSRIWRRRSRRWREKPLPSSQSSGYDLSRPFSPPPCPEP